MIFSRLFSVILRIAQLVFAVIVLGLTAYFLSQYEGHDGPGRGRDRDHWDENDDLLARLIFSVVWSSLSIIFAIIWVIPTKSSMSGFVSDFSKLILSLCLMPKCLLANKHVFLVFTAGWAAVFGVLVDWFNGSGCGSPWAWRNGFSMKGDDSCGQWRAAQAFAFLSMITWFATGLLGAIVMLRLRRRAAKP